MAKPNLCTKIAAHWQALALVLIPLLFSPIVLSNQDPDADRAMKCLYIIIIMAFYWMLLLLPLPVTSLIPMVAFPLAGIMGTDEVCNNYFNSTMFLFVGGLVMAIGLEEVGFQKRFALSILGCCCSRFTIGIRVAFMLFTAIMSMFISNTATTAAMIPLINAYFKAKYPDKMNHQKRNMMLLSIAYAANIGGTGFLTGSPTNLVVLNQLAGSNVGFSSWLVFSAPLMLANLVISIVWLSVAELIFDKIPSVGQFIFDPDEDKVRAYEPEIQEEKETEEENENNEELERSVSKISLSNVSESPKKLQSPNRPNLSMASLDTAVTTDEDPKVDKSPGLEPANQLQNEVPQVFRRRSNTPSPSPSEKEVLARASTPKGNRQKDKANERLQAYIQQELEELGPFSMKELIMILLFIILVALWFTLKPRAFPGWAELYINSTDQNGKDVIMKSASPAILFSILLFWIPRTFKVGEKSPAILDWPTVQSKMPWGVLLMLAGGFALAAGCTASGLSEWLAIRLSVLDTMFSVVTINIVISIAAAIVTEFVSNTATANILVPVLKTLSISLCTNPTYLVVTTVLSCSYAFMLPVATAPNALVFESSTLKGKSMMIIGIGMNVICVVMTNVFMNFYGSIAFEESLTTGVLPSWVEDTLGKCPQVQNVTAFN